MLDGLLANNIMILVLAVCKFGPNQKYMIVKLFAAFSLRLRNEMNII